MGKKFARWAVLAAPEARTRCRFRSFQPILAITSGDDRVAGYLAVITALLTWRVTMSDSNGNIPPNSTGGGWGMGLAIGMALGVAIGVVIDNIAIGIAIGIAMGVAMGAAQRRGPGGNDSGSEGGS